MFEKNSRYAALQPYSVVDSRGRTVHVVPAAPAPDEPVLGIHRRTEGERLDHLAARYLHDATQSWRIAEANDAFSEETLSEALDVTIPEP